MNFYDEKILPFVIDKACSMGSVMSVRKKVVPQATGVVLEVGMGSGINLPLYNSDQVDYIWGLEPSSGMRKKAQNNIAASAVSVKWLDLPGEEISLEDESVDTILLTFTLCTIPDWEKALRQMHRVLKPGGKLLFCEHGLSPEPKIQQWQNRITPIWKIFAGGCHLNRPIDHYLEEGGFDIVKMENEYVSQAPRFAGYVYYGEALKKAG